MRAHRLLAVAVLIWSGAVFAQFRGMEAAYRPPQQQGEMGPLAFGQPFIAPLKLRSWVQGWALTGTGGYVLRCDEIQSACAMPILRSVPFHGGEGYGSLTHSEAAWPWRGQKVELKAELKAGRISGWAGLWVKVVGAGGKELFFNDMKDAPLVGTSGFTWRRIVLDIPADAERISFGVALHGHGAVFVREIQFDET